MFLETAKLTNAFRPVWTGGLTVLLGKRVRRIELLSLAWKAKVLPLNYTRTENFSGS
jgi:hypothetical protein